MQLKEDQVIDTVVMHNVRLYYAISQRTLAKSKRMSSTAAYRMERNNPCVYILLVRDFLRTRDPHFTNRSLALTFGAMGVVLEHVPVVKFAFLFTVPYDKITLARTWLDNNPTEEVTAMIAAYTGFLEENSFNNLLHYR